MTIPNIDIIVAEIEKYFQTTLEPVKGTRIFFEGNLSNKKKFILCSPQSKLHQKGYGWIDLTETQISRFQGFDYCILAFRLEGASVYYMHFSTLEKYLTGDSMVYNEKEGDHWKLHIWPDKIKVVGNAKEFRIEPNNFNDL